MEYVATIASLGTFALVTIRELRLGLSGAQDRLIATLQATVKAQADRITVLEATLERAETRISALEETIDRRGGSGRGRS